MIYCASFMALEDNKPTPESIQRQAALARSPMLRSILEENVSNDHINNTFYFIQDSIIKKCGGRRHENMARQIVEMGIGYACDLFIADNFVDPDVAEENLQTKKTLTAIGEILLYTGVEIGSQNNTRLFLPEIARFIGHYTFNKQFFSPEGEEILRESEGQEKLEATIVKALNLGVYLREYMTNLPTPDDYKDCQKPPQQAKTTPQPYTEPTSFDKLPDPLEGWVEGLNLDNF